MNDGLIKLERVVTKCTCSAVHQASFELAVGCSSMIAKSKHVFIKCLVAVVFGGNGVFLLEYNAVAGIMRLAGREKLT